MKPEIKQLWVDALRSGKYKQGTGQLLEVTGVYTVHCCLGVLCDIASAGGVISTSRNEFGTKYDKEHYTLPAKVVEWAGLDNNDPTVTWEHYQRTLSQINDSGEANFNDIADLIESQL